MRGAGYLFGADVSERFCRQNGLSMIVRSHEVRQQGFSQDHPHCATVFSSSYYCGGSNQAAVVVVEPHSRCLLYTSRRG